jgi:hypothetical protein
MPGMLRVVAVVLVALAVPACASRDDASSESAALVVAHDTVSFAVCGRFVSLSAPTATTDGELTLDVQAWDVAAGAKLDGTALLAAGAEVCVRADLDRNRRIVAATITAAPADPWAAAGLE